jgi:hypothetical protein
MDQREGQRTGRPWKRWGGIGLLMLDRDRFGALAARDPSETGFLVTSELKADGPAKFWVNAQGLSADSNLRIELLDSLERPLPRYSGSRAAVIRESGLRTAVSWQGQNDISDLAGTFKIKISFEGPARGAIELFAIYVGR